MSAIAALNLGQRRLTPVPFGRTVAVAVWYGGWRPAVLRFKQNTKPGSSDHGGIVAVGADVSGLGVATGNSVRVRLSACTLSDNQNNKDCEAVGLRLASGTVTGSQNNKATIELKGDDQGDDPFHVHGTFD